MQKRRHSGDGLVAGAMVLLLTLIFVLPSDGSTQAVASPGDRIRVKQVDGTILTGTLATVSAEAIQLSVDSNRVEGGIGIPSSQIATLERQQGTRSKSSLGAIVGLLAGGAIAVATFPDRSCPGNDFDFTPDFGCISAAVAPFVGHVALGLVAGAVGGYLIGSAFRTENWVIVPLIEVAPTGQGTSASAFGFGLRFARVQLPW